MQILFLLKRVKKYILSFLYNTKPYKWYVAKRIAEYYAKCDKRLEEGYFTATNRQASKQANKKVICIYDGKILAGGLVDRLRGCVSVYKTCKEQGLDFKILFTSPFDLNQYLIPNKINWGITETELNYNLCNTDICYIETLTGSNYERRKQERWFKREFKKHFTEFHVRTNAPYSYDYNFSKFFNELFKPSSHLEKLLYNQIKNIGKNYISTSFRFMNLLNDFNETCKTQPISYNKQEELIAANINQLVLLHKKNPETKILVNSDSITFLKKADRLDFTYVIPGDISHIDSNEHVEKGTHDKTFTDFFMIAHAKEIYLFITGQMYDSGFPYAASLIYNRPFYRKRF